MLYVSLLALEVAHRANIIHRDIKPENILIAGGDDVSKIAPAAVKVSDFGLGYAGDAAASILQSGSIGGDAYRHLSGTIAYMSPEQRDGLTDLDSRTDLYSVGVVLHEMLTGIRPQGSDLPSSIRSDVPRWLDRFFERCYTRRDRRFVSAYEMRSVIERYWSPVWSWSSGEGVPPRMKRTGDRWQCASCERPVQADDQFCIHCGEQLVDHVPRCPTCHGFIGRADNFCILCGMDLRLKA